MTNVHSSEYLQYHNIPPANRWQRFYKTEESHPCPHTVGLVNMFTDRYVKEHFEQMCTLLFDLSYLAHCLFKDGTFVWFDIEAVDVTKVGRNQLG